MLGNKENKETNKTKGLHSEKLQETSTNIIQGHPSTNLNSLVTTDQKMCYLSQIKNTSLFQKVEIILDVNFWI